MLTKEDYEQLGVNIDEKREKEYEVYILNSCERSKMDRTKYPFYRYTPITDKYYITWDQAYKVSRKQSKINPTLAYSISQVMIPKSKLTKKQLQEIKERGW